MEEGKGHYAREMSTFGWSFDPVEKEGKFAFVDASPIRSIPGEVKVGKCDAWKTGFLDDKPLGS